MVPIYLCSVAALALFLAKWRQYRAARFGDLGWLESVLEALRRGDIEDARAGAGTASHPAARVIAAALGIRARRPDRTEAEAARVGSLELQRYERHLGGLSFVAQAAPLFGLLGTVIGMVSLFIDLEQSPSAALDVGQISSGMWTALLTTAAGLVVAVAALAGHSWLSSRTDALRLIIHDTVERALSAMPLERSGVAPVAQKRRNSTSISSDDLRDDRPTDRGDAEAAS